MKIACYIRREKLKDSAEVLSMLASFSKAGFDPYHILSAEDVTDGTSFIVSIGGDGTFLGASLVAYEKDIPLLGVNLGHLGFLAEAPCADIAGKLAAGDYSLLGRRMLRLVSPVPEDESNLALNEITIARHGPVAIGVDVSVNGSPLPTCRADGVIVASASGSTAYNLSAGGPICAPEADVMVITPIAPHNLGVRPLVVPGNSEVRIEIRDCRSSADIALDNRMMPFPDGGTVVVRSAERELKCVSFGDGTFINALRTRLFWGADIRNSK